METELQRKKTTISIVTVVFNGEKTIKRTIESVLNQTYENLEYLIQDGLSTDKTLAIAKSYQEKFERKGISYKIYSEKDSGIYDAMNKGISKATGELVGMINSDDWYEPEALKKVVDIYNKTNFDMCYGDLRVYINQNESKIKKSKIRKYITTRDWNHPTTFVKKEIYEKYQFSCQSIYDDFDFFLKIKEKKYKIVIINEILANFRFGGISNEKKIKKVLERGKIRYHIYREHGFSPFYFFESYGQEFLKYLIR